MSEWNKKWLGGCVVFNIVLASLYGDGSLGNYDPVAAAAVLGVVDVVVCVLMLFYFRQSKSPR